MAGAFALVLVNKMTGKVWISAVYIFLYFLAQVAYYKDEFIDAGAL